jgi:hypothetical protein
MWITKLKNRTQMQKLTMIRFRILIRGRTMMIYKTTRRMIWMMMIRKMIITIMDRSAMNR